MRLQVDVVLCWYREDRRGGEFDGQQSEAGHIVGRSGHAS